MLSGGIARLHSSSRQIVVATALDKAANARFGVTIHSCHRSVSALSFAPRRRFSNAHLPHALGVISREAPCA